MMRFFHANAAADPAGESVGVADDEATRVTLSTLVRLRQSLPLVKRPAGRRVLASNAGGNASRALGRGLDFAEVREYNHGDDVRSIDWKVTARSGRPHTKVFNEERDRPFLVVVDLRSSMFFGTRTAFKSVVAAKIAALVAWAAAANRDRVGGLVFSDERIRECPPGEGSRGVSRLLSAIAVTHAEARDQGPAVQPQAQSLPDIFKRLKRSAHTGSSICLLSDFADFSTRPSGHLNHLLMHNHLAACRIYDSLEAELPPPATYAISDGSARASLHTDEEQVRASYHDQFQQRCAHTRAVFRGHGNSYSECKVDQSLTDMAAYLLRQLPGSA
jgi:uncharacterized protein (DUF58 family)